MATDDKCCSIAPYFTVREGQLDAIKKLCQRFVEKAGQESGCLYYGFSFSGREAHCREGFRDAQALLDHLENIGPLLAEATQLAEFTRLEIHGPEEELAKVRPLLRALDPQYFTLQYGFRR